MRPLLALVLAAACSSHSGTPAPAPAADGAAAAPAPDEAHQRADCEKVLAHTWTLMGGDPDSDKLKGARHERELAECMAHITPAATACVLAATVEADVEKCEPLAR